MREIAKEQLITRRESIRKALLFAVLGAGTSVLSAGAGGGIGKALADATYVLKAGDEMTGRLIIPYDGTSNKALATRESTGGLRPIALVFNDGIQERMLIGSTTPILLGDAETFLFDARPAEGIMDVGMALGQINLGRPPNPGQSGAFGYQGPLTDRIRWTDQTDQVQSLTSIKDFTFIKNFGTQAKAGALQTDGMPAPLQILEGVGSSAVETVDADSTFITYTTGNATGNRAGVQSGTFNLMRRPHFAETACLFKLNTLTAVRLWILVTDTNIGASDNPAGNYYGLRFSSTTDTTIKMVTKDGTTQNVFDTGYIPAIGQYYGLISRWLDTNSVQLLLVSPYINSTFAGRTFPTNLVTSTANLGFQATLETKANAPKSWLFSSWKGIQREHTGVG